MTPSAEKKGRDDGPKFGSVRKSALMLDGRLELAAKKQPIELCRLTLPFVS